MNRTTRLALVSFLLMALLPIAAFASNGGETMPWDQGLTVIMNDLSGTTVKIIGVILIIIAGLSIAFMEGAGVKKVGWAIGGLGLALNAASFLTMMFGNASGFELPLPAAHAIGYLLAGL